MEKDHKKDVIDDLKSIKKDYERHKEDYPDLPAEFKWPVVSMKDSIDTVEAAYNYVCEALQIEFDDEEEESEEVEEEDDDETSVSEDESEEEDSDESDEDDDDESEEEDEDD